MYSLSDQQTGFILSDLHRNGIFNPGLRDELLDHICTLIEEGLENDRDFDLFYSTVITSFYRRRLGEIEEATDAAVHHRRQWIVIGRRWFFLGLLCCIAGPLAASDLHWLLTAGPAVNYRIPFVLWAGPMVYALFPTLVWLVLLLTPGRLDPLIPRGARIAIGWRPFIRVLPAGN